jgi:hypothetical protein
MLIKKKETREEYDIDFSLRYRQAIRTKINIKRASKLLTKIPEFFLGNDEKERVNIIFNYYLDNPNELDFEKNRGYVSKFIEIVENKNMLRELYSESRDLLKESLK